VRLDSRDLKATRAAVLTVARSAISAVAGKPRTIDAAAQLRKTKGLPPKDASRSSAHRSEATCWEKI